MRVLVVDDSTLFRKVVRDVLNELSGVEVVGVAADGRSALSQIEHLRPDVVTLDVEMPELNGIEVLREIKHRNFHAHVVMLSSMTDRGASITTQALRLGAFDFVLKPDLDSLSANERQLKQDLVPKIEAIRELRSRESVAQRSTETESQAFHTIRSATVNTKPVRAIGIGVSTGGPAALGEFLPRLPADLPVPIVIVQHMPAKFTQSLAADLNQNCQISVQEALDGDVLEPGRAYIAPGGSQMKVDLVGGRHLLQVNDDPAERNCKPSVDYLFRSMAHTFGGHSLGIIMTGMGDDGLLGCKLLKRHGCKIIAQDQASCVVYGMPRRVVEAGLADSTCPLKDLHSIVAELIGSGVSSCS